ERGEADLDAVARLEGLGVLDLDAVEEGAVPALEVADEELAVLGVELGVLAREGLVVEVDPGRPLPAHRDGAGNVDLPPLPRRLQQQSSHSDTDPRSPRES